MENTKLLGKVLGETEGKVSFGGVAFDSIELVPASRTYKIGDLDLAVITVALKAAVIAHPENAAMIDAVVKRLMSQVRA